MWDGSSTPHHSDAPRQLDAHHAADDGPAVDAHERLTGGNRNPRGGAISIKLADDDALFFLIEKKTDHASGNWPQAHVRGLTDIHEVYTKEAVFRTDLQRAAEAVFVGRQRVQHVEGQGRDAGTVVGAAVGHAGRHLQAGGREACRG